jgi:hypothetical protein
MQLLLTVSKLLVRSSSDAFHGGNNDLIYALLRVIPTVSSSCQHGIKSMTASAAPMPKNCKKLFQEPAYK